MSVVINTNVDSLKVQKTLNDATSALSQSMQRMSSGLKINSAKDDAAGIVISSRMKVQLNGNKICQDNVQNANAMLSTVEGNVDVVLDNVSRIRDLTLQAKNGAYSDTEISAMQDEVKERLSEIDRISNSAKFSQLDLFGDNTLKTQGVTFQVGANPDSGQATDNVITANGKIFDALTFSTLTGINGAFDLTKIKSGTGNYASFNTALTCIDTAIKNLTDRKSLIGSSQNRLDSALNTLVTQYTNLSSANSIIQDADIASEASKYTQNRILQQVSTSLLAQANQAPTVALALMEY